MVWEMEVPHVPEEYLRMCEDCGAPFFKTQGDGSFVFKK